MISRYSRPIMQKVWEPENRFKIWFQIKAHAADAQAKIGVIPKSAAESLWKHGRFEREVPYLPCRAPLVAHWTASKRTCERNQGNAAADRRFSSNNRVTPLAHLLALPFPFLRLVPAVEGKVLRPGRMYLVFFVIHCQAIGERL